MSGLQPGELIWTHNGSPMPVKNSNSVSLSPCEVDLALVLGRLSIFFVVNDLGGA
jgi:hypothetical protein